MTHEDRFAKKLIYLMPDACSLKIQEYVVDGQKRSKIVHTDFAQDFPDDDISHRIEKIKEIFDTRTFATEFEKDCREILEHIFKCKYCLELKDEISSKKSVRSFVIKLKGKCINNFENEDKFKKFDRLCDYLNIELHDNGSLISSGDKESIIKDFFDCLKLA
ncbi:MAG: hypothetical protein NTZ42_02520 [Candidatus Gribaldobacteria bacterium]|nr:hypothetical protein [Candidatus Gribaldobacteria bacterium]